MRYFVFIFAIVFSLISSPAEASRRDRCTNIPGVQSISVVGAFPKPYYLDKTTFQTHDCRARNAPTWLSDFYGWNL